MNSLRTRNLLIAIPLLLTASLASGFETVVIDPGHGGIDEGTAWYHVREKDTTLAVAQRLEKLLRKQGIKSFLTGFGENSRSRNRRCSSRRSR